MFIIIHLSADNERDVFNEKPTKEEIVAATEVNSKQTNRQIKNRLKTFNIFLNLKIGKFNEQISIFRYNTHNGWRYRHPIVLQRVKKLKLKLFNSVKDAQEFFVFLIEFLKLLKILLFILETATTMATYFIVLSNSL